MELKSPYQVRLQSTEKLQTKTFIINIQFARNENKNIKPTENTRKKLTVSKKSTYSLHSYTAFV